MERNMRVYHGTIVHATHTVALEILPDAYIGIQDGGKIAFVETETSVDSLKSKYGFSDEDFHHLSSSQLLMPGFVDGHIHATQYPNSGLGLDLPLLDWLTTYTFPLEVQFNDPEFARSVFPKVVKRTLHHGTTTACYFTSNHTDSSLIMCDVAVDLGQRSFVGRNCQCRNSPPGIAEDVQTSLQETERFVQTVLRKKHPLITPVITPRFAISCTMEQMSGLAALAQKYDLPIQSHISENKVECEVVAAEYPECLHYGDVYDKANLLTNKTIMAHGILLSDEELDLFKKRGVGLVHCPNSNVSISSGLMDARRVLNKDIKLCLGTDVSGGYSPSILNAMRFACAVSNMVGLNRMDYKGLDYKEAFRLATLGGAQVLGLDEKIGNFIPGKEFDALIIETGGESSPFDVFPADTVEQIIQKFIFLGDDRNVKEVYVAGRSVK